MSRTGNCYDNAVVESFFGTLKTELMHHETYADAAPQPSGRCSSTSKCSTTASDVTPRWTTAAPPSTNPCSTNPQPIPPSRAYDPWGRSGTSASDLPVFRTYGEEVPILDHFPARDSGLLEWVDG